MAKAAVDTSALEGIADVVADSDFPIENGTAPASFADEGYTDDALAIWDQSDVDELVQFMPDTLDLSNVPTVSERQKQAKMAVQKRANDLLGHDIVWVAWRPQEALLVAEGTITEGYFAVGKDLTTNENVSLFIGGVALCRVLGRVKAPMRAKLEKRGRTLVFA